jgi:hypothetical protein
MGSKFQSYKWGLRLEDSKIRTGCLLYLLL